MFSVFRTKYIQTPKNPPPIYTILPIPTIMSFSHRTYMSMSWNVRDLLKVTPSHPVTTLQSRLIDGVISAAKRVTIPVFCNPSQLQLIA